VARAWGRAPDTEEGDVQQGFPSVRHERSGDVIQTPAVEARSVTTITGAAGRPAGRGLASATMSGSSPDDITEGRIEAGGLTFGYLAAGAADAPLALCLHGFPDSAWTWRHLL